VNTFVVAFLSIALSVGAQFSLKAGMSSEDVKAALLLPPGVRMAMTVLCNRFVLAGFALYGLGAVVWLGVLSKWDVSKAYPMVGLGFVFTLAIGWLVGEQVTLPRALGAALICAGVFVVGRS
jgi:drug/metabolite transporter (DMT)-like permease